MQFRTRLYLKLLKAGVKLWIVEADAVWFKDPSSFVLNEPSYDLLTGQDGGLGDDIPEVRHLWACSLPPLGCLLYSLFCIAFTPTPFR